MGMITRDKLKGFVAGAIVVSLLSSTVFAAQVGKKVTAFTNNISIYVEGVLSQKVEGLSYKGSNYIPINAASAIMGKEATWDAKTNSLYIGKKPAPAKPQVQKVTVNNAKEFINALGSNKHIILNKNTYNISSQGNYSPNEKVSWEEVYDGMELTLNSIENLTIEGSGKEPVEIVAEPRYAYIFRLNNCKGITFKNIKAGHTIIPNKYECEAGVLSITSSSSISISKCTLYGCGSEGVNAMHTNGLKMEDSIIEKCNLRVMDLFSCSDFIFKNSTFRNCKYQDMFLFYNSKNINFDKCEIKENNSISGSYKYPLITSNQSKGVKFTNSKFINNKVPILSSADEKIDFTGSTFEGNDFDNKEITVKLQKYLPKAIISNMDTFKTQINKDGSIFYLFSKWNKGQNQFLHNIQITCDENGILNYHYKDYGFVNKNLKKVNMSKEDALVLVKGFATDFIKDGASLNFVNTPAYPSLFDKNHVESWVAKKGNIEYLIMVDLDYGYVVYSNFAVSPNTFIIKKFINR